MTTPKERMSEERLDQLRSIAVNWRGAQPITIYANVAGLVAVELADEINRLRAERIDWARTWKLGKGEAADTFTTPAEWMRRAIKAEAELTAARTVADGEVAKARSVLLTWLDLNKGSDDILAAECAEIADLLSRLSAAKAEAERERDEFKSAYRQAADEVIEQSKRADRCYEAGIETGVAIGEQNKRDGLAEDRGGSLKEVFDTLKARASAAERERDEARALADARKIDADNAARWAVKEACKPWEHCVGDLPEWESPLMNVWQAALTWSEEAIAKHLGVKTYEPGDGSESVEGDYLGSIMSILTHAGLYDSETGDPSHVTAEAKLAKARAALAQARADVLEEAAKWHDQRRRDTPDAFEMEFHEVSAKSIRALKPTPTQESETP